MRFQYFGTLRRYVDPASPSRQSVHPRHVLVRAVSVAPAAADLQYIDGDGNIT
jgi:hypothetical protein